MPGGEKSDQLIQVPGPRVKAWRSKIAPKPKDITPVTLLDRLIGGGQLSPPF